jgi:predicted chitinase
MAGYSVTYSVVDNATKQIDAINRRIAAMRAPVERLGKQISRFMDVSGLNTIAKGFASIGRAAVSVVRTLAEMIPLLGTITGAATIAGMAKLVGSYSDWSKQLTSTADNLGMTTQQLQQFEDATRLAGGKTSDMDEALKALYKTQTDFVRGQASADQIGWLNKLGISVKDANGNLRDMGDLMPEVVRKISEIKNPADRAAASAALLGDANLNLVNTFRQSHQSFSQWLTDASRYTELSDKQKDQLQSFAEAQGRIATAFDHLGQQISATLAKNFTPLLNTLAEFVEKHQPEIIAAVDHISDEFQNWISGIDWSQVKEDIKGIVDLLKVMLDVAEAIGTAIQKTMFLFGLTNRKFTKEDVLQNSPWYSNLTPEQQKQVRQQVGVSEDENAKLEAPQPGVSFTEHPTEWLKNRVFRSGQGNAGYQRNAPNPIEALGQRALRGPEAIQRESAAAQARQASPAGPPPTQAEQQENLRRAMDEQGVTDPQMRAGIGAIAAGEGGFKPRSEDSYAGTSNERIRGIFGGHVAGMTDPELDKLKADPKAFFDRVYGGRLGNAPDEGYKYRGRGDFQLTGKGNYERYGKMIGVDLVNNPDLVNDPSVSAKISVAYMKDRYHGGGFEGMKRAVGNPVAETEAIKNAKYAEYLRSGEFAKPATAVAQAAPAPAPPAPGPAAPAPAQVAQATAPPAQVPPPTPANGIVDVNVTHKNPPPNTAITATATGSGVNVAPPRVEHQELASI